MPGPLALLVLAAVPSLGVPGLTGVDLSPERVAFYEDHLIQELSAQGLKVVSSRDVAALLGIERQKQLLGCDQSSCAVELANALGVDAILLGSLAKLDGLLVADVRVLSAKDSRRLAANSVRAKSESDFLSALDQLARQLAAQLLPRDTTSTVTTNPTRWPGFVIAGAGVAAAVVSVVFAVQADGARLRLDPSTPGFINLADAARAREDGKTFQSMSVAFGVGAGAAVLAGILLAWQPWSGASVSVVPTPSGAQVTLGGAW